MSRGQRILHWVVTVGLASTGEFVKKRVSYFMGWFVKGALTAVGVKLALSSDCHDTTTIGIGASLLVLAVAMGVIFCVELATRSAASDERVAATTMNGC